MMGSLVLAFLKPKKNGLIYIYMPFYSGIFDSL